MFSLLYEEDRDSGLDPDEFTLLETSNNEADLGSYLYTDSTEINKNIVIADNDDEPQPLSPNLRISQTNDVRKHRNSNNNSPTSPLISNSSDSDDTNIKIELLTKKSEIRKNNVILEQQNARPYARNIVGNLFLSSGRDEHLRQLFTRPERNSTEVNNNNNNSEAQYFQEAYREDTNLSQHDSTEIKEKVLSPRKSEAIIFSPKKSGTIILSPRKSETMVFSPKKSGAIILSPRKSEAIVFSPKKSGAFVLSPRKSEAMVFSPKEAGEIVLSPRKAADQKKVQSPHKQSPSKTLKSSEPIENKYVITNNHSEKDVDKTLLANSIEMILSRDGSDKSENVFDEIDALKTTEGVSKDHIVSAVGTVRGVKNRVKERLLNYLSNIEKKKTKDEEKVPKMFLATPNEIAINAKSDYTFTSDGKVIIYITSLGLIRKTKSDCVYVRNAFRNLMFKTEERDITDPVYRNEYCKLFQGMLPPQVIINGRHIGGRDKLELLIETGTIYELCEDIEKIVYQKGSCPTCAGHGYINCPRCLGSGRAKTLRYTGTRELSYLKCTYCKNGLLRCFDCIDSLH